MPPAGGNHRYRPRSLPASVAVTGTPASVNARASAGSRSSARSSARRLVAAEIQDHVTRAHALPFRVAPGQDVADEARVADHRQVPAVLCPDGSLRWNEAGVRVVRVERELRYRGQCPVNPRCRADARFGGLVGRRDVNAAERRVVVRLQYLVVPPFQHRLHSMALEFGQLLRPGCRRNPRRLSRTGSINDL